MVVAAGALHGEAHHGRGQNLDLVGDDVHALGNEPPLGGIGGIGGGPKKSGGRQPVDQLRSHLFPAVVCQLVSGDLLHQKLRVGLVPVEGSDHIIAVAPSIGPEAVVVSEAFRVGIAGQIKPVPPPPLAVMTGAQQALDHALIGIRPPVLQVGYDFGGGGGHPHQVQIGPPQQLQGGGRMREAQPPGLQPGQQEGIHRRPDQFLSPDFRNRGAHGRLEGPELAVLLGYGRTAIGFLGRGNRRVERGARGNPAAQQLQLDGRGRPHRIGQLQRHRRHLPRLDFLDDWALVRISRKDGRAGTASLQPGGPRPQVQPRLLQPLAVAGHAPHLEDGQHVLFADGGKA